jgi:putative hydrolase of the HAD superfamily
MRNIIFDYGGVIIDIDYSRTRIAFERLGVTDFSEHFNQLQQSALFDDFEKGNISEREFRDRLNQQVGASFTDEEIDNAWNAMILGVSERPDQAIDRIVC